MLISILVFTVLCVGLQIQYQVLVLMLNRLVPFSWRLCQYGAEMDPQQLQVYRRAWPWSRNVLDRTQHVDQTPFTCRELKATTFFVTLLRSHIRWATFRSQEFNCTFINYQILQFLANSISETLAALFNLPKQRVKNLFFFFNSVYHNENGVNVAMWLQASFMNDNL